MSTPPDYKAIEEEIAKARKDKELAIESQNFEQAKRLREPGRELLQRKAIRDQHWRAEGVDLSDVVDEESSRRCWPTGRVSPSHRLTEEETARLMRMEEELHRRSSARTMP